MLILLLKPPTHSVAQTLTLPLFLGNADHTSSVRFLPRGGSAGAEARVFYAIKASAMV